jgi:spermidine synthase
VFSWIGLLVAFFMSGAACGALVFVRILDRIKNSIRVFTSIELGIMCFALICPVLFLVANDYLVKPEVFFLFRLLFLVIAFISGLLVGSQFPLANELYLKRRASIAETAGLLYSSDLLGGWFGGIIGAVVLLPVLGLVGTCITVGLLKLTSFLIVNTQANQYL